MKSTRHTKHLRQLSQGVVFGWVQSLPSSFEKNIFIISGVNTKVSAIKDVKKTMIAKKLLIKLFF